MPSGASDEPVIGSSILSRFATPYAVTLPDTKRMARNHFTGHVPMSFHIDGLVRLLNFSNHARVGTRMMLNTSVERIPMTRVIPTDRIGEIGTIIGAMRTEKPMTVVIAERNTATPVERVISNTQSR